MTYSIKEPVIILGCPRSGTSLLFTILSESKKLFSLYRESQDIFDSFYRLQAKQLKIYEDDALTRDDLTDELKGFFLEEFHKYTLNTRTVGYVMREYLLKNDLFEWFSNIVTNINCTYKNVFAKEYRLVEKNPRNCFRVSFIDKLFPDCKFIHLKRDGRSNISSLIEGWKRPTNYVRTPRPAISLNIKGDNYGKWRYVLPPDWEAYINKPLEEVCAFQWISSNKAVIDSLKSIDNNRHISIGYEELISNTPETITKICNFIQVPYSKEIKRFAEKPPVVSTPKKDAPKKDKWKKNEQLIQNIYKIIEPMMIELGYETQREKIKV